MYRLLRWGIVLIVLIAGWIAPSVFAGAPTGSGPQDALMVTGEWQTLAPNARAWFYFDHTGSRSDIEIALDTHASSSVGLAVYTPEQARAWTNDPKTAPIGRGSKPGENTSAKGHALVWLGAFNSPGRFFAAVANDNAAPVSIRLTVSGKNVAVGPTPTPTPQATLANPFATPIPVGMIQGRFVFQEASGGNIYTVNGDGSNLTRVTYGLGPAWSPDGTRIAFARWNSPAGLYIASVGDSDQGTEGSNERRIVGAAQLLSPRWSPDGKRNAFTRQAGGSSDDTELCFYEDFCFQFLGDPFWKLGVVDLDEAVGGVTKNRVSEPPCSNHCFAPTWRRDNATLVYADANFGILSTDTRIGIVRRDSAGEVIRSSPEPSILFNQNRQVQSTASSPDGTQIAFQVRQHDHWEINVMDANGGNVRAVTSVDPFAFQVANNVAPAWSPDGKQILFLSDRNGKWEFFVADWDGSNLRQVLKNVSDSIPIRYNFSNERVIDWIR